MSVKNILKDHGGQLITCRPEDTIDTVATILASKKIGALPVRDSDRMLVGIISERDIVRGMAEKGSDSVNLRVRDLMTADVATCQPEDSIKDVMQIMSRRHIRHLPVLKDGQLLDMLSQRDVMEYRLEATELEANVLRDRVRVMGST
ncbi:MAG: CBS domain-containing protein [Alphaproteobacteria bacterium]|jgi:CBS domain-containing protein|nr:CBS domain-containing protein [Alphaproteobacteria bacterium]MBT7944428.1 CBS domain-containing protein [Alphaproteobacteria bacterium]